MERLDDWAGRLAALWDRVPPVPDLPLPTPGAPGLVTVAATILVALGLMGLVTGWSGRRLARLPLLVTLIGAGLFVWLWDADRDGFGPRSVPEAFAEVAAQVLR